MPCKLWKMLKPHLLLVLTLAGVLLGFTLGFAIRETQPSVDTITWINLPGEMFLRLLKMMIVPIIVTSVITGTASLDPKSNGMISAVSFAYVAGTNTASCIIGIILGVIIKPGSHSSSINSTSTGQTLSSPGRTQDIFVDLIRNVVPVNLMTATFRQEVTHRSNATGVEKVTIEPSENANILGLIFACMVFGLATSKAKEKGKPFLIFFESATTVVLIILRWFLWYSPIGICSLIAASIASISDLKVIFSSLGMLILTVTIGLALIQLVMIPVLHVIVSRQNPFVLLLRMHRAWFVTFASTSSASAIPEMLHTLDEHGVDKRVSRFAVPFSVTIGGNGSGIFIVAAAMFLANLSGVELNAGQVITIGILTAVSCLALPSVPSSSLVSLVIIMNSLGLPIHQLGLLFSVEWFLDRVRTAANAVSHTFVAAFTYNVCKKHLKESDKVIDEDLQTEVNINKHKANGHLPENGHLLKEISIV